MMIDAYELNSGARGERESGRFFCALVDGVQRDQGMGVRVVPDRMFHVSSACVRACFLGAGKGGLMRDWTCNGL